jgi:nucleotide-binding universal stress UspA family protein
MNHLKNIVVGLDFSKHSEQALRQAVRMAQWNKATLHVVYVIDATVLADLQKAMSPHVAEGQILDQLYASNQDRIQKLLAGTHRSQAGLDVEIDVRAGQPFVEILRAVRDTAADLLMLGSNSSSEPRHGAGALATNGVRKAPTKVMLVRKRQTGSFQRVVACVDFSETSRRAVEQAIRVARQDGAHLDIVHAYVPPWMVLHYRAPTPEASPRFEAQYKLNLDACLKQFVQPFAGDLAGLSVAYHLMGSTLSPAEAIVDFLKKSGADLAVLGTRGRSAMMTWFLGTVAERIVRESPCSVLTVKPEGFRFNVD